MFLKVRNGEIAKAEKSNTLGNCHKKRISLFNTKTVSTWNMKEISN